MKIINISIFKILPCAVLFALSGCKQNSETKTPREQKMNIVLIIADDMNGYGLNKQYQVVQCPNLDKFKSTAVNFINAACNTPVCNPSRSSFFSGLYPHNTGAYINGSDGWNRSELLKRIKNIPEHFKSMGYETWGAGKLFHNKFDTIREAGFWDNYPVYKGGFGPFPEEEYWEGGSRFSSIKAWDGPDTDFPDVVNANAAVEFLNSDHSKPFLMVYGLWRPHSPYTAPKRFYDLYQNTEFPVPPGYQEDDLEDVPYLGRMLVDSLNNYRDNNGDYDFKWQRFLKAYAANYSFADDNIGKVVNALDASKYADNTVVIIISDNGFNNGEKLRWGKATLWEQSDYVPFMIREPNGISAECKATVSLVDIYPTLLDYADIDRPEHNLDGHSLIPLIKDPALAWNHPSLTTYGMNYASVRDLNYRYVSYPDGSNELYDHRNDPYEIKNIACKSENKDIVKRLSQYIPKNWANTVGGRLEVPRDYDKVMRPQMKNAPGPN